MALVLVHGGCFTSECWAPTIPYLTGDVLAVDLPGRGRHPADLRRVTVADWAASVVADIEAAGYDDVVLVGHSMAGLTVPRVAALIPAKIRRLVFVSCSVPRDGQTPQETLEESFDERVAVSSRDHMAGDHSDTGDVEIGLTPELATQMFCNDMTAEQTAATLSMMVPEATGVMGEPVDLTGLRTAIPRTWVRLTRDAVLTPQTQDTFIANCGPDVEVVDLEAAHMAMISRPQELAAILNRYA